MTQSNDLAKLSSIANGMYNTISANATAVTAVCSPVVCATSCICSPTICATNLYGNGAALTGIGPTYVCMVACTNVCNGDPVVNCCSCGVGIIVGYSGYCSFDCCFASTENHCSAVDSIAVQFLCSQSCFAVLTFYSTGLKGSATVVNRNGFVAVNAFCVSNLGCLSAATNICCYCDCFTSLCNGNACAAAFCSQNCGWDVLQTKMMAIPSCSGSVATVVMCTQRCFYTTGYNYCCNLTKELKLCFCTTTNQISVISFCCGDCNSNYSRSHFITPDRNYFVTVQNCSPANSTCCACIDLGVNVKCITDTACYLTYTNATVVCGCALKAVFPATCANISGWCGAGLSPLHYGVDKWIPLWINTTYNSSISYCRCCEQKIIAFRPTGDNCIETSCNIICTRSGTTFVTSCLPFWFNDATQCCVNNFCLNAIRSFDHGDCVKRTMWSIYCSNTNPPTLQYKYTCLKICLNNALCLIDVSNTVTCGCNCAPCVLDFGCCCYNQYNNPSGCYVGPLYGIGYNSLSMGLYLAMYPICYQCSCYYIAMSCSALHGIYCNIFGDSGTYFSNDCGPACVFSFRYCQDTTTWTLDCNLRPINNVAAGFYAKRVYAICSSCPKHYNYQPFLMQSNTVVVSAGNGSRVVSPSLLGGTINLQPYVIVYTTSTQNNVCCFLGIAQNTANTGQVVCVAVPGMIDRSSFGTRFFTACPLNCQIICLGAPSCCFASVTTETDTYLGAGFSANANFRNYLGNYVTLQRYYDCYSNTATTLINVRRNCI